jgi:hypothetical protein
MMGGFYQEGNGSQILLDHATPLQETHVPKFRIPEFRSRLVRKRTKAVSLNVPLTQTSASRNVPQSSAQLAKLGRCPAR